MTSEEFQLISTSIAYTALIFSFLALFLTRKQYELTLRREVARRYVSNLWLASAFAREEGADTLELTCVINEAKIVFGGNKKVIQTINRLISADSTDRPAILVELAEDMAGASGFTTKFWDRDFVQSQVYFDRKLDRVS